MKKKFNRSINLGGDEVNVSGILELKGSNLTLPNVIVIDGNFSDKDINDALENDIVVMSSVMTVEKVFNIF